MSVTWNSLDPMVDIALENGEHRRLLLEVHDGQAVEIAEQPDEGFPPGIIFGDPTQRSDVRTRQIALTDWRRGMGRDMYEETQGVNDFRDSQCDTRFANVLVCRTKPTLVGDGTTTVNFGTFAKIVYIGSGTPKWFAYETGVTAKYYSTATSKWVATAMTNGSDFYARGQGGMFYLWNTSTRISQSSNGSTWNTVQVTGITSSSIYGLALHDNKLFTLGLETTTSYALWQSADATLTPATATWTKLGTLIVDADELINQLFVWKFPPDPGRPGIFCLTNRRIYWYDDTADAASVTAWKRWTEWDVPYGGNGAGHAVIHSATSDMYVMPHSSQDRLWQFTGSTIARHGPNEKGGLPPSRQHSIAWSQANSYGIVCWLRPSTAVGSGNKGMVVALTEQDGWHHIFDTLNTSVIGSNKFVSGGGIGPMSVLTAMNDGNVYEQEYYDTSDLPQYATTARTYDADPLYHTTGKTDIGTPTLQKAALYVELNAKIPTGATVAVAYRLDDSDGTGSFTTMTTFTASESMPARIAFGNNLRFRQCELRLTLTRGTATNATPIIYSLILHTTLIVPVRWVYQMRVDLQRPKAKNIPGQISGHGITDLRTWVRALHGQIASFTVAQPADEITVLRAQVTVTPIESPRGTGGRYLLQFRSLETPLSGA